MAYFLGYEGEEYTPIKLNFDNSTEIDVLLDFTLKFNSVDELKNYLFNNDLIKSTNIDLVYLIEKGKKGEKYYNLLNDSKKIYTKGNRRSFDVDEIESYLCKNYYKFELFKHILVSYLKKYGFLEELKKLINNKKSDVIFFLHNCRDLVSKTDSKYTLFVLESIIDSIEENRSIDVDLVIDTISKNDDTILFMYTAFKNEVKLPNQRGLNNIYDIYYDFANISIGCVKFKVKEFINSVCYNDDKLQKRNVFDLGVVVQDYKDLELESESTEYAEKHYESNQDDDDYLEEEDFARIGTTSEAEGFKLRRTEIYGG